MSGWHAIRRIEISRKLRPFQIPHEAGRDPFAQQDGGLRIAPKATGSTTIVIDDSAEKPGSGTSAQLKEKPKKKRELPSKEKDPARDGRRIQVNVPDADDSATTVIKTVKKGGG